MAAEQETEHKEPLKQAVSFRITYFGFGGRAAPLRLAAFLGGLSYEDHFETFDEHGQAKKQGTRRWCGMPELTILDKDGKELATAGQSNACLRYIGTLAGLYPQNPVLRVLVDEILDSVEDMIQMMSPSIKEKHKDKKKKARLALMEDDKLPYWLSKFEKRLAENEQRGYKNGYFVSDELSIADLKFYYQIANILSGNIDYLDPDKLTEACPRIRNLAKVIGELEGVKKFRAHFLAQQKEWKEKKTNKFVQDGKTINGA
eukprot:CAMPEP_0197029602 /NCGR_PEP_ID=MMETSP1384-20130603/9020_1 /TAXON_ID=29189 /ORGANISM="Ammonia sp." /LENGTH=258 /DNA_ID=CAMNT_0042458805 /DNA_START=41 /DNA_END=813 /DNA_ORIENTATION=-